MVTSPHTDEELVMAFVDGDERAFGELLTRYERRVHGICFRYFGDATDAEDAAQDAFLILYRRASTFSGASRFSTWMYRVTTNACNDLARRRARRPHRVDAPVEDLPLADPADEVSSLQLRLDLLEALDQLDPDHRHAVVEHTIRGVPYADIAGSTGVAVGTVKSRVHRGHARLAGILAAADTDPGEPSGRAPPPT